MTKHRKKLIILVIFILCTCIYIIFSNDRDKYGEIYEIKNTKIITGVKDQNIIDAQIHVMILNIPESLYELKSIVEEFTNNYQFNEEEITNEKNSCSFPINETYYQIYFYRESDNLPYDWEPKEGFFSRDRLEFHRDDLIASVKWTDIDSRKKYRCINKSTKNSNYGSVISELLFIENEEVNSLYE